MLVTYVAPNRAHHYLYASALARSGHLRRFVSGFSRFSPRAPIPELGDKLRRADFCQNLYLASLKLRLPAAVSEELAYLSKIGLDRSALKDARQSDLLFFYSGAGLGSVRALKSTPVRTVVEAVNSHVLTQQQILREEHERLRLPFRPFHPRETARRAAEYEEADGIVCPSTFVQQTFLERGIHPARLRRVPFGLELSARPGRNERPGEIFRVLYVGQINIRKGLRYLFEAFRQFRHPRKELWIVGPKSEPSGIDDLAPPEGTRFLGVLKDGELDRAYRGSHVFVLPTLEEGLALVIGEALSRGLPVIATVNSGGADLLTEGVNGFLVPIRSPGAIAEKLQLLADRSDIRERMSAATESRDQAELTWERTGERLVDALKYFAALPKP